MIFYLELTKQIHKNLPSKRYYKVFNLELMNKIQWILHFN